MKKVQSNISPDLLQVGKSFEQKYKAVLDFDGWRVAMLRHSEATDGKTFSRIERHNETHEVFILSEGEADLIIAGKGNYPEDYSIISMQRSVAYDIQPGVWHHAILSPDAHIVLFEKDNTSRENSNYYYVSHSEANQLRRKLRAALNSSNDEEFLHG